MMDIKFIRENRDLMKDVSRNKGINIDIDSLIKLDDKRRALIGETEELKAKQNKLGKNEIEEARGIKEKFKKLQEELRETEAEFKEVMLLTPNVYSEDTPVGISDEENVEIYKWGSPAKFDFSVKDHIEIGKDLDLLDFQRGTKTSGFRGYYLKNEVALLSLGILFHCISKMREKGFSLMIPPTILKEFALIGSGHFPFGKEEVYQIANPGKLADGSNAKEKLYLGGTSEPSLLAYYADSILDKKDLPVKVCGFSQCYRSEAGSYGKDTKGLYRVHEFMKVEQVVLCENDLDESNKHLEEMKSISMEVLEELKLPYRVLQICTGDMGAGKYKMYDIETWMPSRNNYGETHSDSNLTDWQSRRLNIKYKDGAEKKFAYALNNTVIATPRILIAILENYQQKDGTVRIPDVLVKYVGKEIIEKTQP